MSADKLGKLAEHLGLKVSPKQTDEAIVATDDTRALAYAQPCAKFAGLLFYADQSVSWGECKEKLVSDKQARDWGTNLLEKFDLLPKQSDDKKINLSFELKSWQTEAVVFDGKERRREKAKTDVASNISLNGISVDGPRAKVRMIFKSGKSPVMLHVGLWEKLSVYEERELVREHDIIRTVREKLAQRSDCKSRTYDVRDVRLVYFANEYNGGPDLLTPSYFVEVEFLDPRYAGKESIQGPRQVLRLPAFR
jgi:hypothetical protein